MEFSPVDEGAPVAPGTERSHIIQVSLCVLPRLWIFPSSDSVEHYIEVEVRSALKELGLRAEQMTTGNEPFLADRGHTLAFLTATVDCNPGQQEAIEDKFRNGLRTIQEEHRRAHSPQVLMYSLRD